MSFQAMVKNELTSATIAYQWGNGVPFTPAWFAKNLMEEAKMMNINWPDLLSVSDEQQIADNAVIEYAIFYQGLLGRVKNEKEPDNPTEEFHAWYVAQKEAMLS